MARRSKQGGPCGVPRIRSRRAQRVVSVARISRREGAFPIALTRSMRPTGLRGARVSIIPPRSLRRNHPQGVKSSNSHSTLGYDPSLEVLSVIAGLKVTDNCITLLRI
jgi:hypothetical protein